MWASHLVSSYSLACCQRSFRAAATVAADSLKSAAAASSIIARAQEAQPISAHSVRHAASLSSTKSSDLQQLHQLQPALQEQQHQRRQDVSLHQQVLFEMPPAGQPLPRLPRFRPIKEKQPPVPILQALSMVLKSVPKSHTIEAHIRLRVDARRTDLTVRGAAVLPHSWQTGPRIAVFAEGTAADEARAAGAHIVGAAELVASILDSKGKSVDFTACLATPDMMPQLVKVGRILGPKGLMPNPKMGTLTTDLAGMIAELRQGRVEFKMDRTGIVHVPIGKASFDTQALYLNMGALTGALLHAKPAAITGGLTRFVRGVHLASTMGPSVCVEVASLTDAVHAAAAAAAGEASGTSSRSSKKPRR